MTQQDHEFDEQGKDQSKSNTIWKQLKVNVRETELPLLNRQLEKMGYQTLGGLVKDLIAGKITRLTDQEQIDIMKMNMQKDIQIVGLSGQKIDFDFYKKIDIEDFLAYLQNRFHGHTAKCYLNYFEKYANVFFGANPDIELFKLQPHKRAWILQALKKFGDYYYRKYNSRDVIILVKQIIERYALNKHLDNRDKIYLVNPNYVEEKVKKIFDMKGDIGFIAKIGLLTGLREQVLIYIREKEICNTGYGCYCEKLHVVNCNNGMTIIDIGWIRENKKALATILPTIFYERFRLLEKFDYYDIHATHNIIKRDIGIKFMNARKLHYNVMRYKDALSLDEAEILAGRFRSVSARHYVLHDPGKLTDKYIQAWNNFGIPIRKIK